MHCYFLEVFLSVKMQTALERIILDLHLVLTYQDVCVCVLGEGVGRGVKKRNKQKTQKPKVSMSLLQQQR